MTIQRNIFAFTAPGIESPEYISVNHPMPGEPEGIVFTVRSAGYPRRNGERGEISLNRRDARNLGLALIQATN